MLDIIKTMPYRKYNRRGRRTTKKVYPRKTYKKRAKAYVKRQLGISNKLVGFPANRIFKLRYCDVITLNPATAVPSQYQFRANSIFDPDQTGSGHQYLGRDQLAQFYNHYVVKGAKMTVRVIGNNTGLTSSPAAIVSLFLNDDTTVDVTNPYIRLEKGNSVNRLFNPHQGMDKTIILTQYFSAKKFFGVKDVKDNITRLGAAMGTNPTEEAYFTLVYGPADNSSTTLPDCQFMVTIDAIVEASEPQDLTPS